MHVHVADVGAAIEAGIEAGRPHRVSVTALAPVRPPAPAPGVRAVVALACREGLAELFAGEGVACSPRPATASTRTPCSRRCSGAGAEQVVVLPNDAD